MSAVIIESATRKNSTQRQEERHLEIAPTRGQKKSRPKSFYALVTVSCLFTILIVQLLLSIMVSNGAYQISALQLQAKELTRDQQSLTEQLRVLESPQNLAGNAETLGMGPNASTAYLQLSDGTVLGTPHAASSTGGLLHAKDGGPLVPNQLLSGLDVVQVSAVSPAASTSGAPDLTRSPGSVASVDAGLPTPISR